MPDITVVDTNPQNIREFGICGYKSPKRPGFSEKVHWFENRISEGLKIKTLVSATDGVQGMIEYIPGEYCWRPVRAAGYMFIHCLFVGFKKSYKHKGYASMLLDICEQEAQTTQMNGVTIVTRKGSFMVGKDLFLKRGYTVEDKAPPDFELLVKTFKQEAATPQFAINGNILQDEYGDGLTIIRADQCPYTVNNVNEIIASAKEKYGLDPNVVQLESCAAAQRIPGAFGIFSIIYNGKIIAEHPISNTRFCNIMDKLLH